MKQLVLASALLAAACTPAFAQTTSLITPHGTYMWVQRVPSGPTFAKDLRTDAEIAAREAAWEARCRPTVSEPNELGVRRYIYAAAGCEYGD